MNIKRTRQNATSTRGASLSGVEMSEVYAQHRENGATNTPDPNVGILNDMADAFFVWAGGKATTQHSSLKLSRDVYDLGVRHSYEVGQALPVFKEAEAEARKEFILSTGGAIAGVIGLAGPVLGDLGVIPPSVGSLVGLAGSVAGLGTVLTKSGGLIKHMESEMSGVATVWGSGIGTVSNAVATGQHALGIAGSQSGLIGFNSLGMTLQTIGSVIEASKDWDRLQLAKNTAATVTELAEQVVSQNVPELQ